jgi:hypothetical protein
MVRKRQGGCKGQGHPQVAWTGRPSFVPLLLRARGDQAAAVSRIGGASHAHDRSEEPGLRRVRLN